MEFGCMHMLAPVRTEVYFGITPPVCKVNTFTIEEYKSNGNSS